jgi:hypothetical protein
MALKVVQVRDTEPIKVAIRLDPKSGQLVVTPNHINLSIAARNEIEVRCYLEKTQKLEITFAANDSPFRHHRFLLNGNSAVLSGIPLKEKARARAYQCTVKVLAAESPAQTKAAAIQPVECYVTVE